MTHDTRLTTHDTWKKNKNPLTAKGAKNTQRTQSKLQTMNENEISNRIIGLSISVHQSLGPGLLESAYKECLYYRLLKDGFLVEKEKPMPLIYEDVKLECGYRIDILVERKVVIEIKSDINLDC